MSGCGSRLTCEEGLLGIVVPRTSLSVVAGVEVTVHLGMRDSCGDS